MNISLDAVKSYCRIDGEEEDALLLSLVDAAKDYLEGAGVRNPRQRNPFTCWRSRRWSFTTMTTGG